MLYFKIDAAMAVVAVSEKYPDECRSAGGEAWARQPVGAARPWGGAVRPWGAGWLNRNDISAVSASVPAFGFGSPAAFAEALAAACAKFDGKAYFPIDSGPNVSPRFDVIVGPAVGDECSMYFNGDAYPVGKIVKISDSKRVVMVDGPRGRMRFVRRAQSGAWLNKGIWSLVPGVRNDYNMEF